MAMRRRGHNTPQYVMLGILSIWALHLKLQSSVNDSRSNPRHKPYRDVMFTQGAYTDTEPVTTPLPSEITEPTIYIDFTSLFQQNKRIFRDIFIKSDKSGLIPNPSVINVECKRLFERDKNEIHLARYLQQSQASIATSDESYIFPRERCPEFITSRQYIMKAIDDTEASFPIAFSILLYKDVEQAERLLRMVYRPQNYYCLHVDRKSNPATFTAISSIAKCFPNIILASHRSDVQWGQFTVLEPELTCMKDLSRWKWKYFINLTGQEMPLKTNYQLTKTLTAFNGSNDVEGVLLK